MLRSPRNPTAPGSVQAVEAAEAAEAVEGQGPGQGPDQPGQRPDQGPGQRPGLLQTSKATTCWKLQNALFLAKMLYPWVLHVDKQLHSKPPTSDGF